MRTANTQFHDRFQEGKNREMRLKEALVDAHQKFRQNPDMDELNLLFGVIAESVPKRTLRAQA